MHKFWMVHMRTRHKAHSYRELLISHHSMQLVLSLDGEVIHLNDVNEILLQV